MNGTSSANPTDSPFGYELYDFERLLAGMAKPTHVGNEYHKHMKPSGRLLPSKGIQPSGMMSDFARRNKDK
eukprot:scaffold232826_cov53-Attheya_sp.AAC.1